MGGLFSSIPPDGHQILVTSGEDARTPSTILAAEPGGDGFADGGALFGKEELIAGEFAEGAVCCFAGICMEMMWRCGLVARTAKDECGEWRRRPIGIDPGDEDEAG